MPVEAGFFDHPETKDSGLASLVLMLRFHGVAADPAQISHHYGQTIGVTEMLLCSKQMQLKAKEISSNWERLQKTVFPAIARHRDGGFFIIGKIVGDVNSGAKILVQNSTTGQTAILTKA